MTHISADVQRITSNASCMTVSGGRTEQLVIIAGFLPRHWVYKWFSQFHSCGTYSILSRSPSVSRITGTAIIIPQTFFRTVWVSTQLVPETSKIRLLCMTVTDNAARWAKARYVNRCFQHCHVIDPLHLLWSKAFSFCHCQIFDSFCHLSDVICSSGRDVAAFTASFWTPVHWAEWILEQKKRTLLSSRWKPRRYNIRMCHDLCCWY